jgi:hypothetical protein
MQSVQHAARSFPRIIGPFINYYSMFMYGMVKEGICDREQRLEDGDARRSMSFVSSRADLL